jgi:uroporphyrinogen decarboxylase
MQPLTGIERITNILQREPVDRIGVFEHFWGDTQRNWEAMGYLKPGVSLETRFGLDLQLFWAFNFTANLDFEPVVIEETEDTILTLDGNGALLRRHKHHEGTPEHIDFLVQNRLGWEEHIVPNLKTERRRIDFEGYRQAKREAAAHDRFFCWSGVNVFELIHPVCGHEHMLVGMALDPDWVVEMVGTFSRLIIEHWEILFAEAGYPDGIWFYEDMGFKNHSFISPKMYQEIIQPAHMRTIAWAHRHNLPVIMHSCGYVAPLVPHMIESGIDCLQVIEVKAGMNLLDLYKNYGEVLSFMGGIDVRVLYTNDRKVINQELESKIPVVMGNFGYVLHSDHSIPSDVHPDNYNYFIQRGLELGTYND